MQLHEFFKKLLLEHCANSLLKFKVLKTSKITVVCNRTDAVEELCYYSSAVVSKRSADVSCRREYYI